MTIALAPPLTLPVAMKPTLTLPSFSDHVLLDRLDVERHILRLGLLLGDDVALVEVARLDIVDLDVVAAGAPVARTPGYLKRSSL